MLAAGSFVVSLQLATIFVFHWFLFSRGRGVVVWESIAGSHTDGYFLFELSLVPIETLTCVSNSHPPHVERITQTKYHLQLLPFSLAALAELPRSKARLIDVEPRVSRVTVILLVDYTVYFLGVQLYSRSTWTSGKLDPLVRLS